MKDSEKVIIAVKDTSSGDIRPGKILGRYRTRAIAERAHHSVARQAGHQIWHVGMFHHGKLIT